MRIVFHSNFMNHHQYFLCQELIRMGVDLLFIEHEVLPEERKCLGYKIYEDDFILSVAKETEEKIHHLTMSADAVIFGSKPQKLYDERIKEGKLTFNFSERLFKKGRLRILNPFLFFRLRRKYLSNYDKAPYVLCASAFAAGDYRLIGYPNGRFLKWGYFPSIDMENKELIFVNKVPKSIIWVGRFIEWKHPEDVIKLAQYLKNITNNFHIKMIGNGPMLNHIKTEVIKKELNGCIEIVGALSAEQVLEEYKKAEIAIITSDRQEGWGAVVNEAMSAACAVVASDEIGSVPYLLSHQENGIIYKFKEKNEFFKHVENLLNEDDVRLRIAQKAYDTIKEEWNYQIAAQRLASFIEDQMVYEKGPLSQG